MYWFYYEICWLEEEPYECIAIEPDLYTLTGKPIETPRFMFRSRL